MFQITYWGVPGDTLYKVYVNVVLLLETGARSKAVETNNNEHVDIPFSAHDARPLRIIACVIRESGFQSFDIYLIRWMS
jgi:hypothetical protein